jgi:hypothetical protein
VMVFTTQRRFLPSGAGFYYSARVLRLGAVKLRVYNSAVARKKAQSSV